jgi:hypothetical protein
VEAGTLGWCGSLPGAIDGLLCVLNIQARTADGCCERRPFQHAWRLTQLRFGESDPLSNGSDACIPSFNINLEEFG